MSWESNKVRTDGVNNLKLLNSADGTWNTVVMSRDQTAADPIERERLQREHPNEPDVTSRGRVKGYLQVFSITRHTHSLT